MTVTDASLCVSRFLVDDSFHTASQSWLERSTAAGQSLITPVNMLSEVAGAVARRTGSTRLGYQVVQQIRQVPTLQMVAIGTALGDFAAEVASTYCLRGRDAIYVAVAYRLRVPLVSWDREQTARVSGFIDARSPDA